MPLFNAESLFIKAIKMKRKSAKGFTLIEMIMVIVVLGILSVMATGFVKFGTQIYLDASNRDDLTASARFAVERLNRELRSALPNSVRVTVSADGKRQCLEYVPIEASVIYKDIPVFPEPDSNTIRLFSGNINLDGIYRHKIIVYGLNESDIYGVSNKVKVASGAGTSLVSGSSANEFILTLANAVNFAEDSPTNRLFFINAPISYCVKQTHTSTSLTNTESLTRHANYSYDSDGMPDNAGVVMANFLRIENGSGGYVFPFEVTEATQVRNATVLANLKFTRNYEDIFFNNEIQVPNVP